MAQTRIDASEEAYRNLRAKRLTAIVEENDAHIEEYEARLIQAKKYRTAWWGAKNAQERLAD